MGVKICKGLLVNLKPMLGSSLSSSTDWSEIVFLSLFGLMVALRYLGSQPPLQSVDTPVFCEHPLSWGVLISVDFTPLVISIGVRCTVRNLGPSFCAMMHRVVLFVLS